MTMTNLAPNYATHEDREYAWRHAFTYADQYTPTSDEAAEYANHYAALIRQEENLYYWPDHGPTFADWMRAAE